jgi:hypothetical protein
MQKQRELYYLKKAQAVYPELPPGSPVPSESPDFLFRTDSRLLGIELTDYIRRLENSSLTLRTIDSLHKMVAQHAKAKFESKHAISLWTALHWNDRFKFAKKDVGTIASQLTALIETDIPPVAYGGTTFDWESHEDLPIFDAIHRVSVRRLRDSATGVWAAVEAGFTGAGIADIQSVVDAKEPKIKSYLLRCDEVWLLIVADGTHISSSLDIEFEPSSTINTQFARVLLYNGASDVVSRLR